MENVKKFKDFSHGKDMQLMRKFYDALDWCLYKKYADFELEEEGPTTSVEVEDDELYCVVKGYKEDRALITEIRVQYHSYQAADVLLSIDGGLLIPIENIMNLEELTEKMLEVYKD